MSVETVSGLFPLFLQYCGQCLGPSRCSINTSQCEIITDCSRDVPWSPEPGAARVCNRSLGLDKELREDVPVSVTPSSAI